MDAPVYVRNSIVTDGLWEVENFFETRNEGFCAACHTYDTAKGPVTILFKSRKAMYIIDPSTNVPATRDELMKALKGMLSEGIIDSDMEDVYPDETVTIGLKGMIMDDYGVLDDFGFTDEQRQDIERRMMDLEGYWEDTETDMV